MDLPASPRGYVFHYRLDMPERDRKYPTLAARIAHVMETMGWSQADLARELDCNAQTVNNWLLRNGKLEASYAFALQDKHRWNARWIIEGVGPSRMAILDADSEELLERIRGLPAERRKALALLLDTP